MRKLKYKDNKNILCSNCHKPVYMGYTDLPDSKMCLCGDNTDDKLVYDKRDQNKELKQLKSYYEFE